MVGSHIGIYPKTYKNTPLKRCPGNGLQSLIAFFFVVVAAAAQAVAAAASATTITAVDVGMSFFADTAVSYKLNMTSRVEKLCCYFLHEHNFCAS